MIDYERQRQRKRQWRSGPHSEANRESDRRRRREIRRAARERLDVALRRLVAAWVPSRAGLLRLKLLRAALDEAAAAAERLREVR